MTHDSWRAAGEPGTEELSATATIHRAGARTSPGRRRAVAGFVAAAVAAGTLVAGTGSASARPQPAWTQVGTGILEGISGIAPLKSGWVIVRDNKGAGENRVALLDRSGEVTPLVWPGTPGTEPRDIEAVAAVPDTKRQFAVLTSAGAGTIISIKGETVTQLSTFAVPAGGGSSVIESFALVSRKDTTAAVWATRGSGPTPATVYAATFDVEHGTFGPVQSGSVSAPFPTTDDPTITDIRHVSDLVVTGHRLLGPAASDPGNDGPFDSALYDLGSVRVRNGEVTLTLTTPKSLGKYPGHKIEAIGCSDDKDCLLGTDDENQGAWVKAYRSCD